MSNITAKTLLGNLAPPLFIASFAFLNSYTENHKDNNSEVPASIVLQEFNVFYETWQQRVSSVETSRKQHEVAGVIRVITARNIEALVITDVNDTIITLNFDLSTLRSNYDTVANLLKMLDFVM